MTNFIYQFLRKTQKYTGTDNVYLARNGFWITLAQTASTFVAFLLAIVFANLLDPATYGNYKYIISLLGMLVIFALIGIGKAVTQAVARGLEGSFYTGFKTKLKWGLLGSAAAISIAIYYWLKGNNILPIPLLLIAVFLPLTEASRVYSNFLSGKKLFNVGAKFSIANQSIFAAAMITALFLTKNVVWLIAVYLVFHTFLNYFFYLITKIKFKPNRQEDPKTINYGKHISLMALISQPATYLDKILLFNFMGSTQLAIYSFAVLLPGEVGKIIGNISILAIPKLAPKSREEIRTSIMKKVRKLALLTGLAILIYIIIAPFIYQTFFPQYVEAIPYSRIFVLSLISIPAGFLGSVFEAKMMKKQLYLIKTAPFIEIIFLAALVPFFGIWGAIISVIGAQTYKTGLILFLFKKF